MADARQFIKDHQLAVLGTLAGVAVAAVTVFRKPAAPVTVTVPASSSGGGANPQDILSAVGVGAQAASSGFDTGAQLASAGLTTGAQLGAAGLSAGAELGAQGIGAAAQGESDIAGVAETLAQSQAEATGSLASLFTPVPVPVTAPVSPITPVAPTPPPTVPVSPVSPSPTPSTPSKSGPAPCAPAYLGKAPSGAAGWCAARSGTYYLWVNSGGGWHEVAHSTGGWSAFVAAPTILTSITGHRVTLAKVLTGFNGGQYVHVGGANPEVQIC